MAVIGAEAARVVTDKATNFVSEVVGENLKNLVGLMGGDWLVVKREENLARLRRDSEARLAALNVTEREPVSISVAVPLLKGAADESREELATLWANLLAAAMNPATSRDVSRAFIAAVERMEPLDALCLKALEQAQRDPNLASYTSRDVIARETGIEAEQIVVAFFNLMQIGLVTPASGGSLNTEQPDVRLTARGRQLLKLVS